MTISLLLQAVLALLAHVLPGTAVVRLLGLGQSRLERWVMSAVLGGPVAGLVYLAALVLDTPRGYWALLALVQAAALYVLRRVPAPPKSERALPETGHRPLAVLLGLIVIVLGTYHMTTGRLFILDRDDNLIMDPAFQEDAHFHIGLVRSLESRYPPELLSVAGVDAYYHFGYHLQLAAWSRYFGIEPFDGLYRLGPTWLLTLLVLAAYGFALRFTGHVWGAVLASALLFGGGLGFLFFRASAADWWSLVFMDATLVSLFLPSPLLPALSLLFVGLSCLDDYLEGGHEGTLAGAALATAALFSVKEVLAAQVLGGLGLATIVARADTAGRTRRAVVMLSLASAPLLLMIVVAARETNTSVSVRPLEIVRYTSETLGRQSWSQALASTGQGEITSHGVGVALGVTGLWLIGFLGVRLLAVAGVLRDARSRSGSLRHALALTVLMGFPLTLVFRIAPPAATGLSREEGLNDAFWFATQAGLLLWLWTAEAAVRLTRRLRGRRLVVGGGVALLAFPCTVQHFAHKVSLSPDIVPAPAVEAARALASLAEPGEVVLEPLKRVRPSLPAYLAGRPVVIESYVGYNYMFVPRREVDFRRHAVAQFWHSPDLGYASWLLDSFGVQWLYVPAGTRLAAAVEPWLRPAFTNEAASIYRVEDCLPRGIPILLPERISMGVSHARYFGEGWSNPKGSPRSRRLKKGSRAVLYIAFDEGVTLEMIFLTVPHHEGGFLETEDSIVRVDPGAERIRLVRPSCFARRGLNRINLHWRGTGPLDVVGIELKPYPAGAPNAPESVSRS